MKLSMPSQIVTAMVMLLFAFLPWAEAQQGGQGGGSGDTGRPSPKNPPRPPATPPADSRMPPQQTPQMIIISGAVMQEDGTLPPIGAVIQLDCGGSVRRVASVSLNGRFEFEAGDTGGFAQMLPDASEASPNPFDRGSVGGAFDAGLSGRARQTPLSSRLMGCELRAQLNGYRSSALRLDGGPLSGLNDVGTIVVYPIERVRGTAVSATSLLAPKEARKAMEKANKAFKKKEFDETETLLKTAIGLYPKYGEAWFRLGQLYHNQKRNGDARDAYTRAIETDNLYVSPYIQLGWIAAGEKKWQEAADFTERALALDPITFPEGYYLNAAANYYLDNLDLAEKRARQEQRLDLGHRFPQVHLILADIYASKNDTAGSIEEMKRYLKYAPDAPNADLIRSRLEEKERLAEASANK